MNLAKFLRTSFLQNTSGWVLLKDIGCCLLVRPVFFLDFVKDLINIFSNCKAYQLFVCAHFLMGVKIPNNSDSRHVWNLVNLNLDQRDYKRSSTRDYDQSRLQFDRFRDTHSQMFFKISQYSQASLKFIVTSLQGCKFIKKRFQHSCFPVNIAKFLRTSILKNISERLLFTHC